MGELGDRLHRVSGSVSSPDGAVTVTVGGGGRSVVVGFTRVGPYRRFTEHALGRVLADLVTAAFAAHRRTEQAVIDEAFGQPAVRDDEGGYGSERGVYRTAVRAVDVAGTSDDGTTVRISTRGLESWRVTVAAGTVRRLDQDEFVAQFDSAMAELMARYQVRVARLRDEVYDLGYPEDFREASGLGRRGGLRRTAR